MAKRKPPTTLHTSADSHVWRERYGAHLDWTRGWPKLMGDDRFVRRLHEGLLTEIRSRGSHAA